jgi:hypothetical protein
MEKISGILSASPRTQKAEISKSQPARPGAPLTGRPEGKNSLGDRVTLSKNLERFKDATGNSEVSSERIAEATALPKKDISTYKNTSENNKIKIIQDLNRKFFAPSRQSARDIKDPVKIETTKPSFAEAEEDDVNDSTDVVESQTQPENHDLPGNIDETLP